MTGRGGDGVGCLGGGVSLYLVVAAVTKQSFQPTAEHLPPESAWRASGHAHTSTGALSLIGCSLLCVRLTTW